MNKEQRTETGITMRRIVVIGNTGSGKSTLSNKLGAMLGIQVFHLDLILWKPGWQRASDEEFTRLHDEIIGREAWIIDGLAVWNTVRARMEAADTIIFPDYPLWHSYLWGYKRQIEYAFRPRPDLPENCPMLPKTWQLASVIRRIHTTIRPKLLELVEQYTEQKRVLHWRSPREMRRFLKGLEK